MTNPEPAGAIQNVVYPAGPGAARTSREILEELKKAQREGRLVIGILG